MTRNADGTWTRDHLNGAWCRAILAHREGVPVFEGILINFDVGDGEYYLFGPDVVTYSDRPTAVENWEGYWCTHESIEPCAPPEDISLAGAKPEHVFVVDWSDDGAPNFEVFANPERVAEWLDSVLPEEYNVREILMRAVADPGERFPITDDGYAICFKAVAGAERG